MKLFSVFSHLLFDSRNRHLFARRFIVSNIYFFYYLCFLFEKKIIQFSLSAEFQGILLDYSLQFICSTNSSASSVIIKNWKNGKNLFVWFSFTLSIHFLFCWINVKVQFKSIFYRRRQREMKECTRHQTHCSSTWCVRFKCCCFVSFVRFKELNNRHTWKAHK